MTKRLDPVSDRIRRSLLEFRLGPDPDQTYDKKVGYGLGTDPDQLYDKKVGSVLGSGLAGPGCRSDEYISTVRIVVYYIPPPSNRLWPIF